MKGLILANLKKALIVKGGLLAVILSATLAGAADGKKIATVEIPQKPELYASEPQPLTIAECGQCHQSIYQNLKNDGTKHRFACQECHNSFHTYNPKKANWDAIMPKCSSCHSEPHGKAVTDCAGCHSNPHAPKKVAGAKLQNACADCHATPKSQLVSFPSKHSRLTCQTCHTSHGYKPTCFSCHKPHFETQELATCTKCHSVHMPLNVTYDKDTPAIACGSCHKIVYAKWQKTQSKHGKLNCAACHQAKHRSIPQCTECHQTPHKQSILTRFPKCLTCHLDVHDLPAKQGANKPKP
jgi:hypothetical protein